MKSQKSLDLYNIMVQKGYPTEFCTIISEELKTDYTAKRMLGYIRQVKHPSMESIVDEMLAILSERDQIVQKKIMENNQAAINNMMERGFEEEE